MKEETRQRKKSDLKLLAGIAAVIIVLIIVLCILLVRRNTREQEALDADYLAEQMEQYGQDYLPDDPEQIRKIAETAISVLNGMGDADREQIEENLKDAILRLGYDLTEEEAGALAEWLTSLYLNGSGTGSTTGSQGNVTNADSSVYNQIKSDLNEMAAYLEQLDSSITNNRTELENLTVNRQESQEALQEYLESIAIQKIEIPL